jgi:hypothetical protein
MNILLDLSRPCHTPLTNLSILAVINEVVLCSLIACEKSGRNLLLQRAGYRLRYEGVSERIDKKKD